MDGRTPDDHLVYVPTCITPRHGPGAVAGGEKLNGKWNFSTLYQSLHKEWPYYEYLFGVRSSVRTDRHSSARSLPLQLAASVGSYRNMRRVSTPRSRLLFVPKDSRGPRAICCEPLELMYIQQGVARHLMSYIERHPYTRGHVNFIDQSVNAHLAKEASSTREWATIDLTDASDRVGIQLVRSLFPPRVVKKWLALRSTEILLPNGEVLQLEKFAAMGSALCFPVESLTFWVISVARVWEHVRDLRRALESVYVYGDDIIIKDEYTSMVVEALEDVGLLVNKKKSFSGTCPFRESCGIEALAGHDVTPLRIKTCPPQRPSDGPAIFAWAQYASNAIDIAPRRSAALIEVIEKLVGRVPRTPIKQSFLSIVDPTEFWGLEQFPNPLWDPHLCYYKARLTTLKTRRTLSPIGSYARLQSDLTVGATEGDPSLVVDRSSTLIRKSVCFITYLERGGHNVE